MNLLISLCIGAPFRRRSVAVTFIVWYITNGVLNFCLVQVGRMRNSLNYDLLRNKTNLKLKKNSNKVNWLDHLIMKWSFRGKIIESADWTCSNKWMNVDLYGKQCTSNVLPMEDKESYGESR